jgi:hypothetical protein
LIINPDSLALQMSTLRSDVPEGADYYHSRLKATFEDLENLYKERIESHTQKGGSSKRGQFSVRLLAYAPSFGIFSFDPNRSNAAMTVGIYPHRSDFRIPPVFELTPKRDGKWYEYFVGQFEEMWRDAKPWEPENITLGETAA